MTDQREDLLAGKSRAFRAAIEAVEEMGRMAEAKIRAGAPGAKKAGSARRPKGQGAQAGGETADDGPGPDPAAPIPAAR